MAKYRETLPNKQRGVSYGGIETTLISHEGLDLLYFSAVDLLKHAAGYAAHASVFKNTQRLSSFRKIILRPSVVAALN